MELHELRARSTALAVMVVLVLAQSVSATIRGQSAGPPTISGTVRCGGGCDTVGLQYGGPIQSAGSVLAHMTMALDPYTGGQRPDLPTTDGQATFGASDNGHYLIQGLQPGIYDLYARADGYQLTLVSQGITVQSGQSLYFDAYLTPCPGTGC